MGENMADDNSGKRIDEEWKRKAHEEKQRAAMQDDDDYPSGAPPEPCFAFLVSGLVTQALIGLGQMPHPLTKKQQTSMEEAKFAIDTLQMLQDKTKGNLTDDEKRYLDSVLYDLRLRFLDTAG